MLCIIDYAYILDLSSNKYDKEIGCAIRYENLTIHKLRTIITSHRVAISHTLFILRDYIEYDHGTLHFHNKNIDQNFNKSNYRLVALAVRRYGTVQVQHCTHE